MPDIYEAFITHLLLIVRVVITVVENSAYHLKINLKNCVKGNRKREEEMTVYSNDKHRICCNLGLKLSQTLTFKILIAPLLSHFFLSK